MIDVHYNYLIEKSDNLPLDYNYNTNRDPDSCSKKLYDDLKELYFKDKNVVNKKQQYGHKPPFYTLFVDGNKYLLSSDYIGASKYWAKRKGISKEKIIEMLNVSRTIGGHIVWPRGGNETINQARGGAKSFYDRFDLTLMALKIFYTDPDNEKHQKIELDRITENEDLKEKFEYVIKVMNTWKSWLREFNSFEEFCDYFYLCGSFVSERYEVVELAPIVPVLPNNYEDYMENSIMAIRKRNRLIE